MGNTTGSRNKQLQLSMETGATMKQPKAETKNGNCIKQTATASSKRTWKPQWPTAIGNQNKQTQKPIRKPMQATARCNCMIRHLQQVSATTVVYKMQTLQASTKGSDEVITDQ
jgi:hypothetical protein